MFLLKNFSPTKIEVQNALFSDETPEKNLFKWLYCAFGFTIFLAVTAIALATLALKVRHSNRPTGKLRPNLSCLAWIWDPLLDYTEILFTVSHLLASLIIIRNKNSSLIANALSCVFTKRYRNLGCQTCYRNV